MNNQELEEPKLKASTVKLLRPYFDRNCTIDYTSSQTAAARGTVRKYFQVWTKLLIEELDTDFIKMQNSGMVREPSFDNFIEVIRELEQRINS